jgi:methylmalonyl-CoA mutase
LETAAEKLVEEIEEMGGMAVAVASGMPKQRIEEAALRKQVAIDTGKVTIVGVNKYFTWDEEKKIEPLTVDNSAVLSQQLQRLKQIKSTRNSEQVHAVLAELKREAAKSEKGRNLLEICVEAARKRCTVGEISDALESVYGRYRPTTTLLTGTYKSSLSQSPDDFDHVIKMSEAFAKRNGRRPRILVAKIGQDGHDRGAKIIASSFADMGFDVEIGPLFQTPQEVAKQALDGDVHVVGVSTLAAAHRTLIPELINELRRARQQGSAKSEILVVCGGIVPEKDIPALKAAGVVEIFGPGTVLSEAAKRILLRLETTILKNQ